MLDSDDNDSVQSHSSECLDLLGPRSIVESKEELPRPKESTRSQVTYTSSVYVIYSVSSTDDSLTTLNTSSSETNSEYDLSDPEVEIVEDIVDDEAEIVTVQDIDRPDHSSSESCLHASSAILSAIHIHLKITEMNSVYLQKTDVNIRDVVSQNIGKLDTLPKL
uniref:Uncharacterized protein n=1 Tax=Amphimedon queenslandica TaxID=400682 RepID=A0A1X7VE38_AMPQE